MFAGRGVCLDPAATMQLPYGTRQCVISTPFSLFLLSASFGVVGSMLFIPFGFGSIRRDLGAWAWGGHQDLGAVG
jgi:hypothetical protein